MLFEDKMTKYQSIWLAISFCRPAFLIMGLSVSQGESPQSSCSYQATSATDLQRSRTLRSYNRQEHHYHIMFNNHKQLSLSGQV